MILNMKKITIFAAVLLLTVMVSCNKDTLNPTSEFSGWNGGTRAEKNPLDEIDFSALDISCVQLFVTPRTTACQASLSITNCQSLPKAMSIESVMPSNYLILCCPLLLLTSIFPSIRVFSNEVALCIRWPKNW